MCDAKRMPRLKQRYRAYDDGKSAESVTARARQWMDDVVELLPTMRETCALDVAEDGGIDQRAVGRLMGLSGENIRQTEEKAFKRVKGALRDWDE